MLLVICDENEEFKVMPHQEIVEIILMFIRRIEAYYYFTD